MADLITADTAKLIKGAEDIYAGATIKEVMLGLGYAESTARLGRWALPNVMQEHLAKLALRDGQQYAQIGKRLDPVTAENAIAGRLYKNMIDGETKGNDAAALLGKMRRYNAFEKDSFAGVVVLTPGNAVAGKKLSAPDADDVVIDAEIEP